MLTFGKCCVHFTSLSLLCKLWIITLLPKAVRILSEIIIHHDLQYSDWHRAGRGQLILEDPTELGKLDCNPPGL